MNDVLNRQVDFLIEIDKLKGVARRTYLMDDSRNENSAEHSWHVAVSAAVLSAYAPDGVDLARVVRMLLVHDIVEIDAGDTFAYDAVGRKDQRQRERSAGERLFGMLPAGQASEMAQLWQEFDEMETPESRFANAVDRIVPLLHNYYGGGRTWTQHRVERGQVMQRVACVEEGAPGLWPFVTALVDGAVQKGYLVP